MTLFIQYLFHIDSLMLSIQWSGLPVPLEQNIGFNNIRGKMGRVSSKNPARDKQTCAGIANLKIKGFYSLYRLF